VQNHRFVLALLGSYPHIYNTNLIVGVAEVPGLFSAIALFIKELTLLVSYVKNNAFPQPLAEDEEEKHLRLMAEGNQYSRNLLIEHNLRLVAHIVKRL
jgi:RNA polymerase sporulation-specific sigma factor